MTAVHLSPWSADWPRIFASVRDELLAASAPAEFVIEHIGSTAVHGLVAKPVIDVLLGARSLAAIEARIAALGAAGFEYVSKYEHELPLRRYFVKQPADGLRVHVHGVLEGADLWQDHLAFRDALREDAALCDAYQALKLRLAREHAEDKAAYTDAKAPFIQSVLAARRASSA
ncbi:MAG: GrpB family protein [Betaproteobacteria bacterium]|nr:GrpB family protein [Betaproteobacteria bacterium]